MDVSDLAAKTPLSVRMAHLLQGGTRLTYHEIAEQLEAEVNSVMVAVRRGKRFVKLNNDPDGITRIGLAASA